MQGAAALLLALLAVNLGVTTPVSDLSKMEELRYNTMLEFSTLWQEIGESNDINQASDITDVQLMDKFKRVTKNLNKMEEIVKRSHIEPLTWDLSFAQLMNEIDNLNTFFDTLKRQQNEQIRWRHELAWTDMAAYLTEMGENGVYRTMEKLHNITIMLPGFSLFQKSLEDSRSSICELQQSQQEVIYNMYNMVSLAELKGYTMLNFAWMLLKIYDKGNFTKEAELMRRLYTERTIQKVKAAREAMANADRSLYRCDAKEWKEGENFVRITKLMQGYIENEVNLNPEGTCGQNCKYYDVTEYQGCFKNQFCAKQRPCHGQVLHCTYYDSDMNICQAEPSSDRRYDWIEYENRKIIGRKGSCPNRLLKVDSWWRYLFWHCSYCFCLCDDNHPSSDRFFNLRETTSDIAENKVITGVKIVKVNQVIHIQIQQSVLEERGVANKSTAEWVPVQAYRVSDDDVRNGIDYHTLNHRQRGIDLDDAVAPDSHVLTGLRFRRIGNHINLEISATPFDFNTGKLHPAEESIWVGNDNTDANPNDPRTQVHFSDPDVPTRRGPHIMNSKHDQFLLFRESSLSKDASQETIPYLDAQPVESSGLILSGLGLHHRGGFDSGGFLAAKLITYNYSSHMVPQTPEVV